MGNAVMTPCFHQNKKISSSTWSSSSSVKLIFWQGSTRSLNGDHVAGDIVFEFPETMVCHADSFVIGHHIPTLALDDELMPGETYFVLPIDCFSCKTLSLSSLLSLGSHNDNNSSNKKSTIKFGECPFEYLKDSNGRMLIKVMPEFITRLINGHKGHGFCPGSNSFLCSTPELKKHYQMLVKSKDQVWSPKLETISEYKVRGRFDRLRTERKREGKDCVC